MKKILFLLLSLFIFTLVWCSSWVNDQTNLNAETVESYNNIVYKKPAQYISVKYRDTMVDVSTFEYLNTSKSSWIKWAWYDIENEYMIINLDWVNYHYCGFPDNVWSSFENAVSFWKYYNSYIKWKYDCRNWYVPNY